MLLSTLILLASFILLSQTYVDPAIGMSLFSISLAVGSIMILTSTALTLPRKYIGTGIGLHKSANNIGTTIISVVSGYLQDQAFHDGDSDYDLDIAQEYSGVMNLYLAITCFSALLTIVWWILDRIKLQGWLEASKVERNKRLLDQDEKRMGESEPTTTTTYTNQQLAAVGGLLLSAKTYRYCAIFLFFLLVSWAIFFAFALMPLYQNEGSDDEGTLSGGG